MASRKSYGANVGSSSILLIFILLCLVSFAALSIVSANADMKLSDKVVSRTTSYYEACNLAEEELSTLDSTLWDAYNTTTCKEEYFNLVGQNKIITIPTNEGENLVVEVDILYPEQTGDTCYKIESYKLLRE